MLPQGHETVSCIVPSHPCRDYGTLHGTIEGIQECRALCRPAITAVWKHESDRLGARERPWLEAGHKFSWQFDDALPPCLGRGEPARRIAFLLARNNVQSSANLISMLGGTEPATRSNRSNCGQALLVEPVADPPRHSSGT